MDDYRFSVIMSVYKNDDPEQLRTALHSIIHQTLPPNEVVVVVDGPVPDTLREVLEEVKTAFPALRPLYQEQNRGLGGALRIAVENAQYDFLARMDSDDISLPQRFEWQIRQFQLQKDVSVVGGMITEFAESPEHIISKRVLPLDDAEIKRFMKSRCGVNHVTVMFKKADLLRAGNYQPGFIQEDYYLWARMILAGCRFQNIPQTLVNVRSGYDQFARRGGAKYFKDVLAFNRWMHRQGLISFARMGYNILVRGVVQLLLPNRLRTIIYKKVLRTQ